MYYQILFPVTPLKQLSACFQQHREASIPCCYMPNFHCCSCLRHWEVSLNVNQVSSFLNGQWISLCLVWTPPTAF